MKPGIKRFEHWLAQLETLIQKAMKEHNPGLWLYSNDARTPLFMLEGLSKLYADLHNNKKFSKLRAFFKTLEDALGAVDYYDSYAKQFYADPMVPVYIREYMQGQAREKIQRLNELLEGDGWLEPSNNRIAKIRKKLGKADWLSPNKELKGIKSFYTKSIKKITEFVKKEGPFTEMESQVHEVRRELRWLSIYPQALQGCIQTTDTGQSRELTAAYLVPEIVNSRYNLMPPADDNTAFLLLEKNHFFALSWLIAELGKLKDEGLQFVAVAEALQQTAGFKKDIAFEKSFEVFAVPKSQFDNLLARATAITQQFMQEQQLEMLVLGIAGIEKAGTE
ncbi:MAG: hypothetical protein EOO06_05680 [Chitinophagaceae bacterium]|nr:MAG: hypothetical protein EOO06_05680 [Chitinophagaceae bacterium]